MELVSQIKGFPTTLYDKERRKQNQINEIWTRKTLQKRERERERVAVQLYLNVLAGNLGTGPLRLL